MLFAGTAVTKMNRGVRHGEHKGHLASAIRDGLTTKPCLLQSSVSHGFSEIILICLFGDQEMFISTNVENIAL